MTHVVQSSLFNLRVPLPERNEVFLMNTLTDAQLLVSPDVAALLDRMQERDTVRLDDFAGEEREAIDLLRDNGFVVRDRRVQRQQINKFFERVTSDASELHVTVLTTLQCNFACDYCYQADRDDYNKFAEKMTMETAMRVGAWMERELDRVGPEKLTLMFFGGEPLLNLPVLYYLAERMWHATRDRGVESSSGRSSPHESERLVPFGLTGVRSRSTAITRPTITCGRCAAAGHLRSHHREHPPGRGPRPHRHRRRFDESSAASYPALLDFCGNRISPTSS